jgi:hypothetical protein
VPNREPFVCAWQAKLFQLNAYSENTHQVMQESISNAEHLKRLGYDAAIVDELEATTPEALHGLLMVENSLQEDHARTAGDDEALLAMLLSEPVDPKWRTYRLLKCLHTSLVLRWEESRKGRTQDEIRLNLECERRMKANIRALIELENSFNWHAGLKLSPLARQFLKELGIAEIRDDDATCGVMGSLWSASLMSKIPPEESMDARKYPQLNFYYRTSLSTLKMCYPRLSDEIVNRLAKHQIDELVVPYKFEKREFDIVDVEDCRYWRPRF